MSNEMPLDIFWKSCLLKAQLLLMTFSEDPLSEVVAFLNGICRMVLTYSDQPTAISNSGSDSLEVLLYFCKFHSFLLLLVFWLVVSLLFLHRIMFKDIHNRSLLDGSNGIVDHRTPHNLLNILHSRL